MNEERKTCTSCRVKRHIREFRKDKAWCKTCLAKIQSKVKRTMKDIQEIDGDASRDVLSFQLGIPLTDPDDPDVDVWELSEKIIEAIRGVVESETDWRFSGSKADQDVEYEKPFFVERIDYSP